MSTTTQLSYDELRERAGAVYVERQKVEAKIPGARRAAALAYLGGTDLDEAASLRTQARKLDDLFYGLNQLAEEAGLRELSSEIEKRQRRYDKDSKKLEELRLAAQSGGSVLPGTGPSLAIAEKRNQEERNANFERYREAKVAHDAEAKAIAELIEHRDRMAAAQEGTE